MVLSNILSDEEKFRLSTSNLYCKARTQDRNTHKHSGPFCTRRKVFDDVKPQRSKTAADLVADELCTQHKQIKERFMHTVLPMLGLDDPSSTTDDTITDQSSREPLDRQQHQPQSGIDIFNSFTRALAAAGGQQAQPQPRHEPSPRIINENTKALLKRSMDLIVDHSAAIVQGGAVQPLERIVSKAMEIQQLAEEMHKLVDLMDDNSGEVQDDDEYKLEPFDSV